MTGPDCDRWLGAATPPRRTDDAEFVGEKKVFDIPMVDQAQSNRSTGII